MALRWLIEGSKSGDSLVFFFSGHGTQELDLNMDEIDGYDEAICPLDFEYQGKILDDEINATIALSGREVTGALTYSLIKAMENNEHGLTYGHLLNAMRSTIRATKTGIVGLNNGPIASLLNTLLGLKITQVPQLSSSEMFDIYAKQFVI
ncbi:hypothetical protein AHAS_Ahas12G0269700 [Arachis hypogaea]